MSEHLQRPNSSNANVSAPVMLPGLSVRGALDTLWRYRRRSVMFFVGTLALVIVGLIFCPRQYTSDAKLFVRLGRESVALDPTVTTGRIMGVETSRESEINSLLEVITSRQILERVVDETGLGAPHATPIAREKSIIKLKKNLKVWTPKRSNVIGLSYESKSPQKAQMVVNTLIDSFRDEHRRVNSNPGSYDFFEEQTAATKSELDAALANVRDAKIRFGIGSIEGRRTTLQKQIGDNEQHLMDNEVSLSAVRAKIAKLQNGLETLPSPVVRQFVKGLPADAENNMREQLYNLQTREQELLANYTKHHPRVVAIREQVLGAERILKSEKPDRGQATSAVLLTETALERSLAARHEALGNQADRLLRDLNSLNRHEVQLVELERHVKLLEIKYATYTQNLEQARIDRELNKDEITNISVIQPASLVLKPSSPRNGITVILGFLFASVGAVTLAFVSDNFAKTSPLSSGDMLNGNTLNGAQSEPTNQVSEESARKTNGTGAGILADVVLTDVGYAGAAPITPIS